VAVVEGRPSSLAYLFTVDLLAKLVWHPFTRELELDSLRIDRVDGEEADATRVAVLPGARVIEVTGTHEDSSVDVPSEWRAHRARLEFEASAGTSYRILAFRTTRAWPWAYAVVDEGADEVVAHTEPAFDDLQVPRLDPEEFDGWALIDWKTFYDGELLRYVPTGEEALRFKSARIEVLRRPLAGAELDLEQLAEIGDADFPGNLRQEKELRIEDGVWIKRWRFDWQVLSVFRDDGWGVTVGTVADGVEFQWRYCARGEVDAMSQDDWERRLRALAQERR